MLEDQAQHGPGLLRGRVGRLLSVGAAYHWG
jgi:hypothetical protein